MRLRSLTLVGLILLLLGSVSPAAARPSATPTLAATPAPTVRFAQFNASVNRGAAGALLNDLATPDNAQLKNVAEIIQRVNPDVLLINEFDYYPDFQATTLFQQNYLGVSQNGAEPISFPYVYVAPSNTGIPSGFDLDNNGSVGGPNDAFGFGFFPGQFGMAFFSKYPIVTREVRTFQTFLWKDMPGALLPDDPATPDVAGDWYSPEELAVFRLSSKSHWDVPVTINGQVIHALLSHPTPPVFDGPEDRNGTRNHDEIRFWADYITPGQGGYIYDDRGRRGGLRPGASFVIMGDQNADPEDGDSTNEAILQLLEDPFTAPLINQSVTPSSEGAVQQAELQGGANADHEGDPAYDTADFADGTPGNLRADYVLPSRDLRIVDAKVFWPLNDDPLFRLVGVFDRNLPGGFPSSDHRAVYVDLDLVPTVPAREETRTILDNLDEAPNGERLGDGDDPAIWVDPRNPARSLIIAAIKDGGADVYDLEGDLVQEIAPAEGEELRYNNVDLTYGVDLPGRGLSDLVVFTDRRNDLLAIYAVNPATRRLEDVTADNPRVFTEGDDAALDEQTTAYGIALYQTGGEVYAFVSQRSNNLITQLRLIPTDAGVTWELARTMTAPLFEDDPEESQFEGMVVDQDLGVLYAGQENVGIWKFDAAPDGPATGELVDEVYPNGSNLKADVEGLTIYYARNGGGYLLASSQGDSTFAVYERQSLEYLGSFRVGGTSKIDSVEESDGAMVTNVYLGPAYPQGALIVHDGLNEPALYVDDDGELENVNTNFKFVRWERVAAAFDAPLLVDTAGAHPRGLGTPVLDDFARRDGPLSRPWSGDLGGYQIEDKALTVTGGAIYRAQRYRANQEAYVRIVEAGAGEHGVLLKVRGAAWSAGAIKVAYDPTTGAAIVDTYQPGAGWQRVASYPATLMEDDVVGARALSDGLVQVFVGGELVGTTDTTTTNGDFFVGKSGRIGLWFSGAGAQIDDFGGGSVR